MRLAPALAVGFIYTNALTGTAWHRPTPVVVAPTDVNRIYSLLPHYAASVRPEAAAVSSL